MKFRSSQNSPELLTTQYILWEQFLYLLLDKKFSIPKVWALKAETLVLNPEVKSFWEDPWHISAHCLLTASHPCLLYSYFITLDIPLYMSFRGWTLLLPCQSLMLLAAIHSQLQKKEKAALRLPKFCENLMWKENCLTNHEKIQHQIIIIFELMITCMATKCPVLKCSHIDYHGCVISYFYRANNLSQQTSQTTSQNGCFPLRSMLHTWLICK